MKIILKIVSHHCLGYLSPVLLLKIKKDKSPHLKLVKKHQKKNNYEKTCS